MPFCFIQPPDYIPFRDYIDEVDDPGGAFRDNEVCEMNQESIDDLRLQEAGHND